MFGTSVAVPDAGARTQQSAFGGDDQPLRVRVERLSDQLFAHVWPIGVGGIDKINAQFDGTAQYRDALLLILWWPPDTWPRKAHGTETEAIDREVAANGEGTTCCSWSLAKILHLFSPYCLLYAMDVAERSREYAVWV